MEKFNTDLFWNKFDNLKFCTNCNKSKSKTEFSTDNSRKDKLKYCCKECIKLKRLNPKFLELEKLRILKNKDRSLFLQKEKKIKLKKEYAIKINELKEELINNGYKEIPILNNYFINKYGVMCTFSGIRNYIKYKICAAKIIYGNINIYGYRVYKSNKKEYRIHQLVAVTFLNHKINGWKLVVDHVDGNKLNNHVSNLQIISQFQNLMKGRYYKNKDPKYIKWIESIRH